MKTQSLLLAFVSFTACAPSGAQAPASDEPFFGGAAAALDSGSPGTFVIRDEVTPMHVRLDRTTVICSDLGYSQKLTKVLLPELAAASVLNHRNDGAEAPCVSAKRTFGRDCAELEQVIDENAPFADVEVRVTLSSRFTRKEAENRCEGEMIEDVFTAIRGVEFRHQRIIPLPERVFADCPGF